MSDRERAVSIRMILVKIFFVFLRVLGLKYQKIYIKLRFFYYIHFVIICKLGHRKLPEICLILLNFSHFLHLNENLIFSQVLGLKYGYKTKNQIFLHTVIQKIVQNGDAQSQKLPKLQILTKSPFWFFFSEFFLEISFVLYTKKFTF